jgi:hypothetical protein
MGAPIKIPNLNGRFPDLAYRNSWKALTLQVPKAAGVNAYGEKVK